MPLRTVSTPESQGSCPLESFSDPSHFDSVRCFYLCAFLYLVLRLLQVSFVIAYSGGLLLLCVTCLPQACWLPAPVCRCVRVCMPSSFSLCCFGAFSCCSYLCSLFAVCLCLYICGQPSEAGDFAGDRLHSVFSYLLGFFLHCVSLPWQGQ